MASFARDFVWRTIYRVGFPVARLWWRLSRPSHEGALVAVLVGEALLVVQSSYRREWNLPGGGVRAGETPHQAALRELREEIGLAAPELSALGEIEGIWDCRRDRVHLFEWRLPEPPSLSLDKREIVAAKLVSPAELDTMAVTGPLAIYRDTIQARHAAR